MRSCFGVLSSANDFWGEEETQFKSVSRLMRMQSILYEMKSRRKRETLLKPKSWIIAYPFAVSVLSHLIFKTSHIGGEKRKGKPFLFFDELCFFSSFLRGFEQLVIIRTVFDYIVQIDFFINICGLIKIHHIINLHANHVLCCFDG